ncbi:hypothetical protein HOY80DRAFT_616760 [Tuber brumale]|nr:hypothetical protein HOY80DRAFT_616760 [Tuber brumale]
MGSLVTGWRGYILFFSFLSLLLSFFFVWTERTDFTYYTPHELHLSSFNYYFGPPVLCPFGSDCPFPTAVLSLLQAAALGYFFCIFLKRLVRFREKKDW